MDDDWEKIIDEPKIQIAPKPTNINKWDGEDEEDDVKDSWEDEEEKKDAEKVEPKVVKTKPKKTLEEKIAERERLEEERAEDKKPKILSATEILEEKLRLQKIQEEADLKLALETFGVTDKLTGIDVMNPTNNTTLFELIDAISKKILLYKSLEDFPSAIEELIRATTANLTLTELQKVKKTIDNIYTEKQKIEREKSKKGGKGKPKAKLRMDDNSTINDFGYDDGYDYEDFM